MSAHDVLGPDADVVQAVLRSHGASFAPISSTCGGPSSEYTKLMSRSTGLPVDDAWACVRRCSFAQVSPSVDSSSRWAAPSSGTTSPT